GERVGQLVVEAIEELPRIVTERKVAIGIIAAPASAAQEVAEALVSAGVTSVLNFAPTVISVPEGVSLRKVDLSIELQILSFYQQRRDGPGPEVDDLLEGLG
ncbi:MAG: redox-sensing transcriptional repressor Rex, partial [Acidimicrobiales bacterium]